VAGVGLRNLVTEVVDVLVRAADVRRHETADVPIFAVATLNDVAAAVGHRAAILLELLTGLRLAGVGGNDVAPGPFPTLSGVPSRSAFPFVPVALRGDAGPASARGGQGCGQEGRHDGGPEKLGS